ncbi:hypothetical protein V1264_002552 [Littorina saxatilis]|uniref:Uncharacterized protein n=2 Tax=Littorina saxatilis TaxID=31220 RepID=A0AAN9B679_9CAEN
MAYFRCRKKFKRVGHKLAVCLSSGTWSQQTPVCVGQGCPDLGVLPDVTVAELYKGGILQFTCPEGMRREGPQQLMCDGTNWSDAPPKCLYGVSLGCDFEDASLCGWSQATDDDFDWTWTSGATPTSETGPDGDHTTGSGHYVFMESSAPQKSGQVARIISPPYHPTVEPTCVEFYYHMKGPRKEHEVGDLDVFVRPSKDDMAKDANIFHRNSYQDDDWVRAQVTIPAQQEVYRIVFQATRRESWTGDIGLDDIKVYLNCSEMTVGTTPRADDITTASSVTTMQPPPGSTGVTTPPPPPPTTTTTATTTTTTTTTTTPEPTTTTTSTTTTTTMQTTQATSPTSTTTTTMPTSTTSLQTVTTRYTMRDTSTPLTSTSAETHAPYSTRVVSGGTTLTPNGERTTTPDIHGQRTTTPGMNQQRTTTPGHNQDFSTRQSTASSILPSSSTTDVSGSGSSEGDNIKDYTEGEVGGEGEGSETDTRSASSSQGAGPTVSDYLPLIIGVTLGVLVGVAVVGVLAWLWTRNKRKQKALRVEEDQLNIIGSIEPSSYSYPLSGSEH